MKAKHIALFSLILAVGTAVCVTPGRAPAQAQSPGGGGSGGGGTLKIAIASTAKIFTGMKEKTDVRAKIEQQVKQLREEEQSRRQKVQDLQQQLDLLKPDSSQYEEAQKAFTTAAIEFKNWGEVSQAQSARNEKQLTKMLFDKITVAIAEIAKERGIDFVIADQPPFAVDRMSPAELQQAMVQRQILYANASLDLTQDVIARLDQQYNAQKK